MAPVGAAPAKASHTLPTKLTKYPLVGAHNPRWGFLRDNYSESKIAGVLARYDAIVSNHGVIKARNVPVLTTALNMNPRLVLVLQWAVMQTGRCDSVGDQLLGLEEHLLSLGDFRSKLSGIQIDGGGNLATDCSNGLALVKDALTKYRQLITRLGLPAALTANGAHFPVNVDGCRYDATKDGYGGYQFRGLQRLVNGVLKESWTDRRRWQIPAVYPVAPPNIGGLLEETCAWHTASVQPSVVYGFGQSCTPWWYVPNDPACTEKKWTKARVAFATAQMYNRTIHMHTAAAKDPDGLASKAHVFWLDYYAVSMATGSPPIQGTNKKEPGDDDYAGQLTGGGYLGAPVAAGKRIGGLSGGGAMVREFQCGYVMVNWSNQTWVYQPPVATQMVRGTQDPAYDRGESWGKYSIPAKEGRVLIKQSCLARKARKPMNRGTWRP